MTPQEIRDAIAASPELQALGQDTQAIADALSVGRKRVESRIISARGIAAEFPGGPVAAEVVLMKLEGAAAAASASTDQSQKVLGSLISRQLRFLAGEGLDFGSAALRGMLDQFVGMSILTQGEVDGLKALADVPATISEMDVRRACWSDNGTWSA
jgi:hypothetical protein